MAESSVTSVHEKHDYVLKKCKYEKHGCYIIDYHDAQHIGAHQDVCNFRPLPCIVNKLCPMIPAQNFFEHHVKIHGTPIVTPNDTNEDVVYINFPVEDGKVFYFIALHNEKFVLRLVTFFDNLTLLLCSINKNRDHISCSVSLQNEELSMRKRNVSIFPISKIYDIIQSVNANGYNLSRLAKFSFSPTLRLKCKVRSPSGPFFHDELTGIYQCTICKNCTVGISMLLCSHGHSACSNCIATNPNCILCGIPFNMNYRNLTLESHIFEFPNVRAAITCNGCKEPLMTKTFQEVFVSSDGHSYCSHCNTHLKLNYVPNLTLGMLESSLNYPCIYREYGCKEFNLLRRPTQHLLYCSFKRLNCPFKDNFCKEERMFATMELVRHLKENHSSDVTFGNNIRIDTTEKQKVHYFIVFDHIFCITFNDLPDHVQFYVQEICATEQLQHFLYKIKYFLPANGSKYVSLKYSPKHLPRCTSKELRIEYNSFGFFTNFLLTKQDQFKGCNVGNIFMNSFEYTIEKYDESYRNNSDQSFNTE